MKKQIYMKLVSLALALVLFASLFPAAPQLVTNAASPMPTIADGTFITYGGDNYVVVGGAPIPITNWANIGGEKTCQSISLETYNQLRQYPADEPFVVGIGDDDNYIRLSSDSSDFDVTFTLGATPNLLLSNVDSVIDGQITSTNTSLCMDSLHITSVAPGEYELSFFDPHFPPKQDEAVIMAPRSVGDDGTKQMSFTIR